MSNVIRTFFINFQFLKGKINHHIHHSPFVAQIYDVLDYYRRMLIFYGNDGNLICRQVAVDCRPHQPASHTQFECIRVAHTSIMRRFPIANDMQPS